ncbi:MAG: phosphoenolpyruvate--protein phosphotransferase [Treponema sp.]|jgi:phosphotransferase system enzyme I (PtsI)|nr:phosphoenolpyruvate--protein phosphotransferase [Treponema sp.]
MVLSGKCAAPGVAVGRIFIYKNNILLPKENFIPEKEQQENIDRYLLVKKQAMEEFAEIKTAMRKHDPKKAEIFEAYQEIINDIVINEEIPSKIRNENWAGDWAIYQVYETVIVVLQQTADSFIAERAVDFDNVRSMLLRLWYGEKNDGLEHLTDYVIIAAHDLLPSDIACIDRNKVLAIITETGGITSHTAIIAKSYGIPTVLGINELLDTVKHGQMAVVNADEGQVILDPEESVVEKYTQKSDIFLRDKKITETYLYREGCTADGVRIDIGLNISNVDMDLTAADYTDSVGIFRTEFLYMGRDTLPDEDEQFTAYSRVLERYGQRPVIIRTLDIGGDKELASMELPEEKNPFLGNRALRFCFSKSDIFITQLKAALRASVNGNLWLMLPMVSSLEDIRRAKEFICIAKEELKKEGAAFSEIKTGIMIEIPSIALISDLAAKEVDFASIGSNDLCQYLCAADRMNSDVESYYQSYHPAMFRLLKDVIKAFDKAEKPISICGELGAERLAIPILVGLGLRKLSMGAASVATVKRSLSSITLKQAEEIAAKVLELPTAAEVKKFLAGVKY